MNHSEVSASVVMLYPFDRNIGYSSAGEHVEFGSLGPAHFTGNKASPHLGEESSRGINEQQDFQRVSDLSSPDQPASPRVHRYSLCLIKDITLNRHAIKFKRSLGRAFGLFYKVLSLKVDCPY